MLQDPKHVRLEGGTVAFVSETNINRRTGLAVILLWPAELLALTRARRERIAALSIMGASSIAILIWSGHQSSQLGLAVSAIALALASVSAKTVRYLAYIAWVGLTLFMIPIVTLLTSNGADNNSHLFPSARHRVVIWSNTVKAFEKAPIRGVGADATAYITLLSERSGQLKRSPAGYTESTARHAHNIFLQNWYELGLIGGLLYGAAGLALIRLIGWLPANLQRFGLAHFAATTGMFTFSYSIWQMWVLCGIVLSLVLLAVALRLHKSEVPNPDRA
jgi:O-antigen ligase